MLDFERIQSLFTCRSALEPTAAANCCLASFELRLPKLPKAVYLTVFQRGRPSSYFFMLLHTSGRGPEDHNIYFQVASRWIDIFRPFVYEDS